MSYIDEKTGEVKDDDQGTSLPIVYQDSTGIIPYDDSQFVINLPERVSWNKDVGEFVGETFNGNQVEFRLVSVMMLWAKWSDKVGQPEEIIEGAENNPGGYEPGMRLLFEVEDMGFYYTDFFGLAFRSAQGIVKRARMSGGFIRIIGKKPVNTKYGLFYIPELEKSK